MLADTRPESIEPPEATHAAPAGTERVAQALINVQAPVGRVAVALSRAQARPEDVDAPSAPPAEEKE
jgi:hypothetical protein